MRFLAISILICFFAMTTALTAPQYIYDFTMKSIDGKDVSLSDYKGKVLLVVNVASECGYTPQYVGLQDLYAKYKDRGLVVLGFPANNFGSQEPGSNEEIKTFCSTKYSVTFPMFSKISVLGDDMHPLYKFLTRGTGSTPVGDVKWNFEKFLIDKNGSPIKRYRHKLQPESEEIVHDIEEALR